MKLPCISKKSSFPYYLYLEQKQFISNFTNVLQTGIDFSAKFNGIITHFENFEGYQTIAFDI